MRGDNQAYDFLGNCFSACTIFCVNSLVSPDSGTLLRAFWARWQRIVIFSGSYSLSGAYKRAIAKSEAAMANSNVARGTFASGAPNN